MQEMIDYTKFTFRLFLTPYGIVAQLIILGLYAVYLFAIQRGPINVPTFVKLIAYPFMLTYGLLMLVVANLLGKDTVQRLGLLIMFMPIIISFFSFFCKGDKSQKTSENRIIFGTLGSGRAHHLWDDLKPCPCECKEPPLLMYDKEDLYYCGGPTDNVFAVCPVCGRHTEKSDISITINNWNNNKIIDISEMEFYVMSRKEFLLNKMHEAQSFDLSKEDVFIYFERISHYINAHAYSAFRHVQEKHPIEPLSERQEICSQNAIDCLFKKDFVQALHETLDVLSDNNKETRLNYNEYVVLQNILTIYNHLKVSFQ